MYLLGPIPNLDLLPAACQCLKHVSLEKQSEYSQTQQVADREAR
jgi:hypothetical protein